jgi:uncharacterized protein YcfJ
MNRSMLMGVVVGVAVATAGGVLGYQYLNGKPGEPAAAPEAEPVVARAQPAAAAPAPRPAAAPAEECWDEEVATTADPKDRNRIAGTAIGAVVGGAIGRDVGDRDITTAAGAAAGALIGRKIQEEIQENRADTRTTTTTERRCAPAGAR